MSSVHFAPSAKEEPHMLISVGGEDRKFKLWTMDVGVQGGGMYDYVRIC